MLWGTPQSKEKLQENLLGPEDLEAHSLPPLEFIELIHSGEYKLFDLRDRDERTETPVKIKGTIKCTVDQFAEFLKKPGVVPKSKILLMDNVGKQAMWVQYHLIKNKRSEYYFLEGGVAAWYAEGFDAKGNPPAGDK